MFLGLVVWLYRYLAAIADKSTAILIAIALLVLPAAAIDGRQAELRATTRLRVSQAQPIAFEPNLGQSSIENSFITHQNGFAAGFGAGAVRFWLRVASGAPVSLKLSFDSSNQKSRLVGERPLQGTVNYLRGKDPQGWRRNVPTFEQVRYRDLYPGIDLLFYGNGGRIEHDFVISPKSDFGTVAMRVEGARRIEVTAPGALNLETQDGGRLEFRKPIAYQQTTKGKKEVAVAYDVKGTLVKFAVGAYDHSLPLIIDPVLDYSTYIADANSTIYAATADAQGNTYITGITFDPSYPVTSAALQRTCGGNCTNGPDAFVTKLNANGTGQVYSTFLGGSDYDQANGIAVDSNGNAVIVGITHSSDFPIKNPVQSTTTTSPWQIGFVTSLSADGSSLNYSSEIGGQSTYVNAVAIDGSGNAYVTGITSATQFPTTPGALSLSTDCCGFAVFVSKFLTNGSFGYSAVIGDAAPTNGGGGPIGSFAIAVDATGAAYLYGKGGTNWPITSNAYQSIIPGALPYAAPFVTKVAADGASLIYSTFLGNGSAIGGIKVDGAGQAILTGSGADSTYPTTSDALVPTAPANLTSSWLTILNTTGTGLAYSSYLVAANATSNTLATDSSGNIWVAGLTQDAQFPLLHPVQSIPGQDQFSGTRAGFLMKFDPTAKNLLFSSYFGAPTSGADIVGIATDASGVAYIVGNGGDDLYTTPGAFRTTVPPPAPNYNPTYPFAAKIDPTVSAPSLCIPYPDNAGVSFGGISAGTTGPHTLTITNCGTQSLTVSAVAVTDAVYSIPDNLNQCKSPVAVNSSCTIVIQFSPTTAVTTYARLNITSNASIPLAQLSLAGTGTTPQITLSQNQLQFDPLLVGQSSASYSIFVTNSGYSPLRINLAATSISGDFSYTTQGCDADLTGQFACLVAISFTPTAAGSRTGQLSIASNDPVNPIVTVSLTGTGVSAYPVPLISQLNPPTIPIGTAPFTLDVYGSNFFPQSVVLVNGQPQVTTYLGGPGLRATIDPSLRTDYGELSVTVFNPAPGGGGSGSMTGTLYREVSLPSSFMVSVPSRGLLYASIPATASNNANTVVPIDPVTGTLGVPIPVGNDPRMIVASDDGKYLYVALYGDQAIQRINLSSSAVDRTFPFPSVPNIVLPPLNVTDMHVVPGSPTSLVAAIQSYWGVVALFNDSGLVNYVPTADQTVTVTGFAFLDAKNIYALPFTIAQNAFFNIFTLDSAGIHFTPYTGTNYGGNSQTGSSVVSDGKLMYTGSGQVWDPATQKLVGTFSNTAANNLNYLALDNAAHRIYMLDFQPYGSASDTTAINAYDTGTLQLLNSLAFPVVVPYASGLARWGTDGLAFLGQDSGSVNQELYVLRSSMVTQAAVPIATLSATSLDFGNQDQGTVSASQTITLTNSGSAALNIASIAVSGPFSSGGTCATSVAAGSNCTITIAFSPTVAGSATGVLTISDNTPTSPHTISLSGTGTSPSLTLGAGQGGSTTATVTSGQTANYQLAVSGTPGFSGSVSLTCTGAPVNASCSVTPSTVTLAKGGNATFTISVATESIVASMRKHSGSRPVYAFVMLGLCAILFSASTGRRKSIGTTLLFLSLMVGAWTACGGGGGSSGIGGGGGTTTPQPVMTAPGNYTVTVTATSGAVSVSQKLTLVVQ